MPSIAHWIVLGDIHNDVQNLEELPDLDEASGVIITGDLTFLGGRADGLKVLDAFNLHNPNIYAQIGNMDKPEITKLLREKNYNLHGQARRIHPDITLIGVGGSPVTPFHTPSEFREEEIAAILEKALAEAGAYKNLILVSHAPPLNTACDRLKNGDHVGSRAIRDFIEKVRPAACLCGHIHESRAMDRIGDTTIVNPGPFGAGGYAILALNNGRLRIGLCDMNEGCTVHCPWPDDEKAGPGNAINYNGKIFSSVANSESGEVSSETVFHYHQAGEVFWAEYAGGEVLRGFMVGLAQPDGQLHFHYQHLNREKKIRLGKCRSRPERLPDGRLRLHEEWQWLDGEQQKGVSTIEEKL